MADFADKPGYAFGGGPPRAVSEFLRGKTAIPTRGFRDLEPQEHAVAFTVAQSAKFDILGDVRDALQQALDAGQTFETFAKGLAPKLQEAGWWGVKTVDGRERQLGSPRRLKTIYRANMRAARAAGQWERIERVKDDLPYLVYRLGPSERHRPHHESKNGWVLPVDDPFWNEWMPPNGWGCKCHVRQIGAREAGRLGIVREVNIPRRSVRDPVTLKPRDLPAGLDPAWSSNPGKTRLRNAEAFLEARLEALARRPGPDASPRARELAAELGAAMTRAAARDVALSWRVSRLPQATFRARAPVAMLPADVMTAGSFASPVVTLAGSVARKTVGRGRGELGDLMLRLQRGLAEGAILSNPQGGLIVLDFADGDTAAGRSPHFMAVKQKPGDDRPFVSTVFEPNVAAYIWNAMAKGARLQRDSAAFRAWRLNNPREK